MRTQLLDLFRKSVRVAVGNPSDVNRYYEKYFNHGIRLCYEMEHSKSAVAMAELLVAFEKCHEWKPIGDADYKRYRTYIINTLSTDTSA